MDEPHKLFEPQPAAWLTPCGSVCLQPATDLHLVLYNSCQSPIVNWDRGFGEYRTPIQEPQACSHLSGPPLAVESHEYVGSRR